MASRTLRLSPAKLGLPTRFDRWRSNQYEAVWRIVEDERRFQAAVCPTGFGKSLMYVAQAVIQGYRTCVLTSTKGLQSQIVDDFESIGFVDVRGAANYDCLVTVAGDTKPRTAETGPCRAGHQCDHKETDCGYYAARRIALGAELVVTNYSYWLAQHAYGEGLGIFDCLVLDEAHAAPDELSDFLSVTISDRDMLLYGMGKPSLDNWRPWVDEAIGRLKIYLGMESLLDNILYIKKLLSTLLRLKMGDPEDWVVQRARGFVRWDIIWPFAFAEPYLFLGTRKILLVSATVRPKTLQLLGLKPDEAHYIEYPSSFDVARRPVYYHPVVKMHKGLSDEGKAPWFAAIDDIISERLDRKGIIHTVSYKRRDEILATSRYRHLMDTHAPGELHDAVMRFKSAAAPRIFVSPSLTTGYDFPYDECEYQIISKIPFPDISSNVVKVRTQGDPDYGIYLALQTLVQMAGRGMRAEDDSCETFILDSNYGWLRKRYRQYLPKWYRQAVREVIGLPEPLSKLTS